MSGSRGPRETAPAKATVVTVLVAMALLTIPTAVLAFDRSGPTGASSPASVAPYGLLPFAQLGGTWKRIVGSHPPPSRDLFTMAFDATDGYVVLFGGVVCAPLCVYLNDTWTYEHGVWTNITPTISPPGRFAAAMAFDRKDGYLILFGGDSPSGRLNDTWAFSGGVWTRLVPRHAPPPRDYSSMAYDVRDGYTILFGGQYSQGFLNDTWAFASGKWIQLSPAVAPPASYHGSMAYDGANKMVMLFGGTRPYSACGHSLCFTNDTWSFSGGAWTNLTGGVSPSVRDGAAMGFDARSGFLLLFGGLDRPGNQKLVLYNDTWVFQSGSWTQLVRPHSPSTRSNAGMTWDAKDGYLVLFGGDRRSTMLNDTWKFV